MSRNYLVLDRAVDSDHNWYLTFEIIFKGGKTLLFKQLILIMDYMLWFLRAY